MLSSFLAMEEDKMMGKKPAPINNLDKYNFAKLTKSEGTPRERRRFLAFAHIQDGCTFSDAAKMVKISVRSLMKWVSRFRESGLNGLMEKPGRGAKPYLPPEDYESFRKLVNELQSNREGGRVRGKDIADELEKKYGKRPSKSVLYRALHNAGLVWITGRSQHPKSDQEAQAAFKKTSKKT
jgi:transposase